MAKPVDAAQRKRVCGIVMPISDYDGCSSTHWADVLRIITDAATEAGLAARLVSETMESNLIHKEILGNIYNDDLVVVDVSGRNPNVFFELGVRMATQKPTVIVKDNATVYPFDTAPNRFIEYPRDLRHPAMESFKLSLKSAMLKTIDHTPENSFIGQLGPFHVPKIEEKEVSINDAVLDKLESLDRRIAFLYQSSARDRFMHEKEIPLPFPNMSATFTRDGFSRIIVRKSSMPVVRSGIDDFVKSGNEGAAIKVRNLSDSDFIVEFASDSLSEAQSKILKLAHFIDDSIPF